MRKGSEPEANPAEELARINDETVYNMHVSTLSNDPKHCPGPLTPLMSLGHCHTGAHTTVSHHNVYYLVICALRLRNVCVPIFLKVSLELVQIRTKLQK